MPQKYRDVRAALLDAGWTLVRQRGSHEVWSHPDREGRIVVAGAAAVRKTRLVAEAWLRRATSQRTAL